MRRWLLALPLTVAAVPALAQERDYCPARPGLGEPACTMAPGQVSLEIGAVSWEHASDPGARTDTVTLGDTLVRIGVTDSSEVSIGWAPFISERTRDPGGVSTARGGSDVTVSFKQNLHHPDGSGFALALEPHAVLPVAGMPGGAGDWSAGLVMPASFDLGHGLSLQSTSEADAATNADRHGRHLALGEVAGLGVELSDHLSATGEVQLERDWDPSGHSTQAYAGIALALSLSDDLQLDTGAVAGLNAASSDVQLYAGIARRF
jgi:Putative MetA-pathway of phenol degradation